VSDPEEMVIDLCNQLELTDQQCDGLLNSIVDLCEALAEETKRSRAPKTPYQRFITECLPEMIKKKGSAPEAMRLCAKKWKRESSVNY